MKRFLDEGKIDNAGVYNALLSKLEAFEAGVGRGKNNSAANVLQAFINQVTAQSGKHITTEAAALLIADAEWIIAHLPPSK